MNCAICGLFIYPDEDVNLTEDGEAAHVECIEDEELDQDN